MGSNGRTWRMLAVIAVLAAACGGGGPSQGDQAVCDASLALDQEIVDGVPDPELFVEVGQDVDLASADASDEALAQLGEEMGIAAATAQVTLEETGGISGELIDEMVAIADDLSVECERLGL